MWQFLIIIPSGFCHGRFVGSPNKRLELEVCEDNVKLFKKRLRQCEAHINKNYDVDGLCRAFPRRIEALIAAGGDRLRS